MLSWPILLTYINEQHTFITYKSWSIALLAKQAAKTCKLAQNLEGENEIDRQTLSVSVCVCFKGELDIMAKRMYLQLKILECSCQSWLGAAEPHIRQSKWCFWFPAPLDEHMRRRHQTGTAAWKPSSWDEPELRITQKLMITFLFQATCKQFIFSQSDTVIVFIISKS